MYSLLDNIQNPDKSNKYLSITTAILTFLLITMIIYLPISWYILLEQYNNKHYVTIGFLILAFLFSSVSVSIIITISLMVCRCVYVLNTEQYRNDDLW